MSSLYLHAARSRRFSPKKFNEFRCLALCGSFVPYDLLAVGDNVTCKKCAAIINMRKIIEERSL